jgi:hypothetical protein
MSSWIKYFNDGSEEKGSDEDIEKGLASWSRGRLEGIESVSLFKEGHKASIVIPNTEWHHFDRYVALLEYGANESARVARVIQAEIKEDHVGRRLLYSSRLQRKEAIDYYEEKIIMDCLFSNLSPGEQELVNINKEHTGRWFTFIWNEEGPSKIGFSDKGRML